MNKIYKLIILVIISSFLWSCEDVIYPELPFNGSVVVIDAWVNNMPEPQKITVKQSLPYFEAEELPGVSGASVQLIETGGKVYVFEESDNQGEYIWSPTPGEPSFGAIDNEYILNVSIGENVYNAVSKMNRVPEIDSISYRFEKGNDFFPDAYFAGVYADDFTGVGDTYWIKAWKNGVYLNKPNEISIAYDASFSPGAETDGITFIQPIRDSINPIDQDSEENFIPPYLPNDSVYVEIHSLSNTAFTFLNEVRIQTDRPGGFAELFASPLSNVPTNIYNTSSDNKVVGFFNVSAVSSSGKRLDPDNLPPQE